MLFLKRACLVPQRGDCLTRLSITPACWVFLRKKVEHWLSRHTSNSEDIRLKPKHAAHRQPDEGFAAGIYWGYPCKPHITRYRCFPRSKCDALCQGFVGPAFQTPSNFKKKKNGHQIKQHSHRRAPGFALKSAAHERWEKAPLILYFLMFIATDKSQPNNSNKVHESSQVSVPIVKPRSVF